MNFYCYVTFFILTSLGHVTRSVRITPPKKLGPGETRVQEPGWKHCIHSRKAKWPWQKIRNDGYPKFGGLQLQCSWILEAPIGWKVKIAFQDLDMAGPLGKVCRAQYVEVIDVGTGKSQGRFCGQKPPGDYVSSGSVLRIDLQGDKSRGVHRGFDINFKFVNERPGFRDEKTFYVRVNTSPGKANFNNFMSQQQRRLSARKKPGPKPPGKFIYASDRALLPTTQPPPESGWHGNDETINQQPKKNVKTRIPSGAKISANVVPTPRGSNGNRIFAVNHRIVPTNSEPVDHGWEEEPTLTSHQPHFYGKDNQPPVPTEDVTTKQTSTGELSTTHLIIIVVALISCFVIIAAVYFVKRLYFDKLKEIKKEEKNRENKEIEMESNFGRSLPGLSGSGSLHSTRSVGESLRNPSYRNTPLPPIPHHEIMTSLPVTSRSHHRSRTLSMNPEPIYSNERSMTLQPSHVMSPRHNHRRDVTFQRPLPEVKKDNEVDEDYCSGSDEHDDVATLRRVYSKWEMDEKKRKKR